MNEIKNMSAVIPNFCADGLVPVVVQNKNNGTILMLAYANREAYLTTLKTGYA